MKNKWRIISGLLAVIVLLFMGVSFYNYVVDVDDYTTYLSSDSISSYSGYDYDYYYSGSSSVSSSRSQTYSASMSVITAKFDELSDRMDDLFSEYDCILLDNDVSTYGSDNDEYQKRYMYVMVPADNLSGFLDAIRGTDLGSVSSESVSMDDITDAVDTTESDLEFYRELESKYESLMDQAETVDEILAVQEELLSVKQKIASLEYTLENMNAKIMYSYVSLTLTETTEFNLSRAGVTYGSKLQSAFANGWLDGLQFFANLSLWIVGHWLVLVIIAVAAGVYVYRRKKKKKSKLVKTE